MIDISAHDRFQFQSSFKLAHEYLTRKAEGEEECICRSSSSCHADSPSLVPVSRWTNVSHRIHKGLYIMHGVKHEYPAQFMQINLMIMRCITIVRICSNRRVMTLNKTCISAIRLLVTCQLLTVKLIKATAITGNINLT